MYYIYFRFCQELACHLRCHPFCMSSNSFVLPHLPMGQSIVNLQSLSISLLNISPQVSARSEGRPFGSLNGRHPPSSNGAVIRFAGWAASPLVNRSRRSNRWMGGLPPSSNADEVQIVGRAALTVEQAVSRVIERPRRSNH